MKLTIDSVLGCEHFEDEFDPGPVYVHGPNSSGKTSIATALGALASWTPNPLALPSGEKKDYITIGRPEARAELDDGRVAWDGGAIEADPDAAPDSHPHAVGLIDFTRPRRSAADRAACWEELFLPASPREILEPHWTFPADQLDAIVKQIDSEGWEKALANAEGHRAAAKRRWTEIAGERYGSSKAKTWTPPNWREELAGESEESLQARLTEAADARSRLIAMRAVSEEDIARARRVRDEELPAKETELRALGVAAQAARADLETHRAKVSLAEKNLRTVWDAYQTLKTVLDATAPHACPSCEAPLEITEGARGVEIVEWRAPEAAEIEAARDGLDDTRAKGVKAKSVRDELKAGLAALERAFESARAAVGEKRGEVNVLTRQAAGADDEASEGPDRSELEALNTKINEARDDVAAWRMKREADKESANVSHYDDIVKLLGPTGARASTMRKSMADVRSIVGALCKGANWTPVEILQDYSIRCGGVPVRVAAANEKLSAQWLCQIAAAYLKRTEWLVLDRADTLKFDNWWGLMTIVDFIAKKLPHLRIVVCATGDGSECPAPWRRVNLAEE